MTGRGGWPMTVFLTPGRRARSTAAPTSRRRSVTACPPFRGCCREWPRPIAARRGDVAESGKQLLEQMRQSERAARSATVLTDESSSTPSRACPSSFDEREGGTSRRPQVPQPMIWDSVLRFWGRSRNPRALEMVRLTLTAHGPGRHVRPARRRLSPLLGGRAVAGAALREDALRQCPARALYLHAWLATGDAEYRRVAEETPRLRPARDDASRGRVLLRPGRRLGGRRGQVLRLDPGGDPRADPGRGETAAGGAGLLGRGGRAELRGPQHPATCRARPPRWRSASASPSSDWPSASCAPAASSSPPARGACTPGSDDKVLAVLERAHAHRLRGGGTRPGSVGLSRRSATRSAEFLTSQMIVDGRLLRSWKDGRPHILGYLEDHAMVGAGLLDAYEATFDRRWLDRSRALAEVALQLFWDEEREAFFDTGSGSGGARRPAPEPLRQRGAERHLGDHRVAASGSRAHLGEDRYEAAGAPRAPAHGGPHAALSHRVRALPRRAGLPPGAGPGDRRGLARRPGRRGAPPPRCSPACSAAISPTGWWRGWLTASPDASGAAASRRQAGRGRAGHRVSLPEVRVPGTRRRTQRRSARQLDGGV